LERSHSADHRFLDGNGRALRAFLEVLARQAGHAVDLARIDSDAWNAASISGYHSQDYRPMCAVIAAALADPTTPT
jgi:fido (protein-threonine AMPylation protein)